ELIEPDAGPAADVAHRSHGHELQHDRYHHFRGLLRAFHQGLVEISIIIRHARLPPFIALCFWTASRLRTDITPGSTARHAHARYLRAFHRHRPSLHGQHAEACTVVANGAYRAVAEPVRLGDSR